MRDAETGEKLLGRSRGQVNIELGERMWCSPTPDFSISKAGAGTFCRLSKKKKVLG
jgi:hypothetical protein